MRVDDRRARRLGRGGAAQHRSGGLTNKGAAREIVHGGSGVRGSRILTGRNGAGNHRGGVFYAEPAARREGEAESCGGKILFTAAWFGLALASRVGLGGHPATCCKSAMKKR